MAYGAPPKNSHTRPAGRVPFGMSTNIATPHGSTPRNPDVTSKGVRNGAEAAKTDPNNLEGKLYVAQAPASMPQTSHTGRAVPHAAQVGYATDGSGQFNRANHVNTGRHDGGANGKRATTDDAAGMNHVATGGRFGEPQKRPATNPATRGTTTAPHATLDRK
jgi:hypothetical protein